MVKDSEEKNREFTEEEGLSMETMLTRRKVLEGMVASALLASIWSCSAPDGGGKDPQPKKLDYSMTYKGFHGLAELPFFEINEDGNLRVTVDDLPKAIDFHTHLGFVVGSNVKIDFLKKSKHVHYLLDCDEERCVLDMRDYMNKLVTPEMKKELNQAILDGVLKGTGPTTTHTVPNLLAEMDLMHFDKAIVHAIGMNLLKPDNMTDIWADAVKKAKAEDRLIIFCSVHPNDKDPIKKLREYHKQGFTGFKFHPTMQNVDPDDPKAMELFEECDRLKMPVFFHAGRAGIEAEASRVHAEVQHYKKPVAEFPNTHFFFGHSGCRDWRAFLDLAKEHKNVWMDLQGQGIPQLKTILKEFDKSRLVFGSDWPFYPLAATLAKILIVTYGDKKLRDDILANNARHFLGLD